MPYSHHLKELSTQIESFDRGGLPGILKIDQPEKKRTRQVLDAGQIHILIMKPGEPTKVFR